MDRTADSMWGKTTENDDGVALEAMLHAEERGSYSVLGSFIERYGQRLRESPDEGVGTAYLELVERTKGAFEYEAEHGRRSLMKWDHPDNIEWVRIGLIKLTERDRRAFEACNGFASPIAG